MIGKIVSHFVPVIDILQNESFLNEHFRSIVFKFKIYILLLLFNRIKIIIDSNASNCMRFLTLVA